MGIVDNYAPKENQVNLDVIKFFGKEDDIKESEDNFNYLQVVNLNIVEVHLKD